MALVFQYGSNLDTDRLNGPDRLRGDAKKVGIAVTQEDFEFKFDIWSTAGGGRAAADIVPGTGRKIWGVVYEIPDFLIRRDTARARGRKSLDAIEGEGRNYERTTIDLNWSDGQPVLDPVITYLGKDRRTGIKTSQDYVNHILKGARDHDLPEDYIAYVKRRISDNNPALSTTSF